MKLLTRAIFLLFTYPVLCSVALSETPFSHIWSGFSTSLSNRSTEQRLNAIIAGQALDNAIIPPGGLFSFNELVGARDRNKGFVPAPHLNSNGTLDEAPGGGICQLASTVYNAGLLAGMEIVERHPHSRAVAHVPPGRDATISSWRKDLKMRNPSSHPLMLRITSGDNRLTASFRSVVAKEFVVEVLSRRIPLEPETVAGRNAGKGQPGAHGFSTQTRRIIRKNHLETNELVSEDLYPAPSRIIAEGGE